MNDSAFKQAQRNAGAIFPEHETDAPAALHFGDPAAEYADAKVDCGLFDFSDRVQIEITGKDRVTFLHNFCTNDIKKLSPGGGCEAFITSIKGRVLGHVFVFAAADSLWLETVPGSAGPLLEHLGKYVLVEEVELHDRSEEFGELFVSGPRSAEKLAPLIGPVADFSEYGHGMINWQDVSMPCRRVDLLNQPGFLLSIARDRLGDLWSHLSETIKPAGSAAFRALRIEAGFPLYGIDFSEENIAQEVGRTAQAISFTKGCYLGQEPIARLDAMGHVNRELCGLKLSADSVPSHGALVQTADGTDEIGRITSAAVSPADGNAVALACLKSGHVAPGTAVSVLIDDTAIPATVFQTKK